MLSLLRIEQISVYWSIYKKKIKKINSLVTFRIILTYSNKETSFIHFLIRMCHGIDAEQLWQTKSHSSVTLVSQLQQVSVIPHL